MTPRPDKRRDRTSEVLVRHLSGYATNQVSGIESLMEPDWVLIGNFRFPSELPRCGEQG